VCGDGFAGFEEDGGCCGAEEDLWPCGDVVLPEGFEKEEEGCVYFAGCEFTIACL
jgi:hypothetical protein